MTDFVTAVTSTFDELTHTITSVWDNGEVTVERFNEEGETVFFQSYTGEAAQCFTVENGQIKAIVEMEDMPLHTDEKPFCSDETCPCHAEALHQSWQELQAVPSYVECNMADIRILLEAAKYGGDHTLARPFCARPECGCRTNDTLFDHYIMEPMLAGLLTSYEANRIMWNEQI